MTTTAGTAPERLEFGPVWAMTGRILRHIAWPLLVMGVVLFAIPNTLFATALNLALEPLFAFSYNDPDGALFLARAIGVGRLAFPLFTIYLLQAAVLRHVFAHREGRRATIVDSLVFAFGRTGPALALTLVVFLCVLAGTVLLIVPGLLIWSAWGVAGPAALFERTGLNAALERSGALTRGNRGVIFAVGLFAFLALFLAEMVIRLGTVMWLVPALNLAPAALMAPMVLASLAVDTLAAVVFAVATTAIYIQLTGLGRDSDATAEVFG